MLNRTIGNQSEDRIVSRTTPALRFAIAVVLALSAMSPATAQSTFSHRISIKLPKGANGMQPDLALVYEPASPNGIVGMGWSMTGLAAITRVNQGNGITYSASDSYADSNFGVLVPYTEQDGTTTDHRSLLAVAGVGCDPAELD